MNTLIKNATIVNEGRTMQGDVRIQGQRIQQVAPSIATTAQDHVIEAEGLYLVPGMIDAHVHFREPGFPKKGTIHSESMAAVAGGITSFMDMPNTMPHATTWERLEEKFERARETSWANYSFFFGIDPDHLEEALSIDNRKVCGITDDGLYFNSSENLLCNFPGQMEWLFSRSNALIALHCEDEDIIAGNLAVHDCLLGGEADIFYHSLIRSEAACFEATERVVASARQYGTRLHLLHLSTGKELDLLDDMPLSGKRITAEVCLHHLYFSDRNFSSKGNMIKWNPSIKTELDRLQLLNGLKTGKLDQVATDHAPHLYEEKTLAYKDCKSGAPLVQHAFPLLLTLCSRGEMNLEMVVEKACHHPAELFKVEDRGYIREGYFADLVLLDLQDSSVVESSKLLYGCGWSPLEGDTLKGKVLKTFVNGALVYDNGFFTGQRQSMPLSFAAER